MENATIVTLGQSSQVSNVSFEDAFGEYSEARGRKSRSERKAERQARRMQRIADRDARKTARQEMRKKRKEAREEHRAISKENRQARKDIGAKHRMARKGMRDEASDMDETTALETGVDTGAEQGYAPEGGGDNAEMETPTMEGGESGGEAPEQDGGYAEDGGSDSEGGDEGESGDGSDESVDDSGFDGELMGNNSDLTGVVNVPQPIKDLAKKIEWNKELISRLRVKGAEAMATNKDTTDISNQIIARQNRIAELELAMKKYVSCDGEYSGADGKAKSSEIKKRRKEQQIATSIARKERMANMTPNEKIAYQKRIAQRNAKIKATAVNKGLNPQFSPNKIVVPAEEGSNFYGTGLVGIDESNDFDAPETRIIEMQSNADGMGSTMDWTKIIITLGITTAIIWGLRKYKVI
jgi:hypothetical protein